MAFAWCPLPRCGFAEDAAVGPMHNADGTHGRLQGLNSSSSSQLLGNCFDGSDRCGRWARYSAFIFGSFHFGGRTASSLG